MTKEEKELLLKDLLARLPCGIIIYRISDNSTHKFIYSDIAENIDMFSHFLEYFEIDDIKPYLRPFSNMTEEENGYYITVKCGLGGIYTSLNEWKNGEWRILTTDDSDVIAYSKEQVSKEDVENWVSAKLEKYRNK